MAVFLVRAMGYSDNGGGNLFVDDDGFFYENSADRLKTAKVTLGCNPPVNDKYCGESFVTRGQMAAFLVRAMGYTDNGGGNLFIDDDGHLFENAIDKLGTAGVTKGCNPPVNDKFCPNDFVTRGQMAAFLTRALGLTSMKPPPPGNNHLVITEDTWFDSPIVLGPGSTIQFSNGAQLICAAGCHADWDGITATGEGGVKFLKGSNPSTIRNSLFDVQPSGEAGHHPLHWHLMGDDSRGTLVQNVTIRNSTNSGFAPHGSHGISLIDVRVENVAGAGLWWPSPGTNETCSPNFQKFCTLDNTNDLTVNRMVVDGVRNAPGSTSGFKLAAFLLGAGSGNSITNSVARNVAASHLKDCAGFQWPSGANQNVGGNVWVFKNNRSEASGCHGIFVWQNDDNIHIIDGFVGVPSGSGLRGVGGGIDHGAYGNKYDYRNVDVPYIEIHAHNWKVSDSTVGKVYVERHVGAGTVTFTNVLLDVIHMNDAAGNAGVDLIINGGNATCGVVLWENPHPDSRVIIDGVACARP